MKWMIVGGGSLGLLYAGKLARVSAPEDIVLLTRSEDQAHRLNREGLRIVRVYDHSLEEQLCRINAVAFHEAVGGLRISGEQFEPDWIMLMVKQQHITAPLSRSLAGLLGRRGRLLCFQNGIGHTEQLSAVIPADRIYAAVTTEGARKTDLNLVQHTGQGETTFGKAIRGSDGIEADKPRKASENNEKSAKMMLAKAGFACRLSKNMDKFIWDKLLINSVINPLTAMYRICNGQLLESPFLLNVMGSLFNEGCDLAKQLGIEVSADLWQRLLRVCERTSGNESSMLQDVLAGRGTELEWITGSLLRLADRLKVRLPAHEETYRLLKMQESEASSKSW